MPFEFRWPFSWPRRERKIAPATLSTPRAEGTHAPTRDAPAPVQLARAEPLQPPPDKPAAPEADLLDLPNGPDLGQELHGRLPTLATPPILGRMGGLPAMAQTLPTVERFLQTLRVPVPPPQPTLPGLGETAEFAAHLPSLVGYTEPGSGGRAPAFPAQLEPPSEPTDVLAPPGGMPGQIAGLSGAAAVLEPSRPPVIQPLVVPAAAPLAGTTEAQPPAARVQGVTEPTGAPAPVSTAPPQAAAAAPAVPPIGVPPAPAWTQAPATITQVLSPQQTLTGNILPTETGAPIQREMLRAAGDEWLPPAEFAQPAEQAGERVSPEQRDNIESQRGQGRPLEAGTRQRFEQAYGQPLDDVRIHTGPTAHAAAESLNAIAFASGQDVFFTQNTYEPGSPQGLSLIGHELAHVIQQQYGVAGDADELRPPDDRYERQADQLATRALDTPVFQAVPDAELDADGAPVQRTQDNEWRSLVNPPTLPTASTWSPGQPLQTADSPGVQAQPLATALPLTTTLPEEEPIQRFTAANAKPLASVSAMAGPAGPASPASPVRMTNAVVPPLPNLERPPQRAGQLMDQLLSPPVKLSNPPSLSQNLPGLGWVSEAGQGLPIFRSLSRGLPGLGSVPDLTRSLPDLGSASLPDTSGLTSQLPNMPSMPAGLPSLGDGTPAMPDLGGVAHGLSAGLPNLPNLPGLPSLGGLTAPEMPLAEGMGAAGQAAGEAASGAMAAGQQALGTITGMAPSGGDVPAAPALPSLDKLTEHIWKEVQRKLKVERERSRGLA